MFTDSGRCLFCVCVCVCVCLCVLVCVCVCVCELVCSIYSDVDGTGVLVWNKDFSVCVCASVCFIELFRMPLYPPRISSDITVC